MGGVGIDAYEEHFGNLRTLHFQYLYVGLSGLDGQPYLTGANILGVALSTLMRLPAARRAELTAQALDRVAKSEENDWRKFLLGECVQAYAPLSKKQRDQFDRLLKTDRYSGARAMNKTWYEQGEEKGIIKGQRLLLQEQLESQFGPLSDEVKERLQTLPPARIRKLGTAL